jgi:hypothetical protein
LFDLASCRFERDPERIEGLSGQTFALLDQSEKEMFGADVAVMQMFGFLFSQGKDPSRLVIEALEHEGENPTFTEASPVSGALRLCALTRRSASEEAPVEEQTSG